MNYISPNSPAYYLTSVTKDRLPVFRLDAMKSVACGALNETRISGKFLILAYVIMPDYTHQNPVRLGLVERAEEYKYSSARIWNGTPLEDEPLMVDIDQIKWRKGGVASSKHY